MTGKLIEDLFVEAATSTTAKYYSAPISAGDNNGVMGELWVTSIGANLDHIKLHVEGGNDGINFDPAPVKSTGAVSTAPLWEKTAGGVTIEPWAWYRLCVEIEATGAGATTALVSASIRTFRAG